MDDELGLVTNYDIRYRMGLGSSGGEDDGDE